MNILSVLHVLVIIMTVLNIIYIILEAIDDAKTMHTYTKPLRYMELCNFILWVFDIIFNRGTHSYGVMTILPLIALFALIVTRQCKQADIRAIFMLVCSLFTLGFNGFGGLVFIFFCELNLVVYSFFRGFKHYKANGNKAIPETKEERKVAFFPMICIAYLFMLVLKLIAF